MSLAIAVNMAGSSVKSIAGQAWRPSASERKSATRSMAAVAEPPVLEEDVDQLPQHVIERLNELLADVAIGDRGLDLPLRPARRERDRQAAPMPCQLKRSRRLAAILIDAKPDRNVGGPDDQLDL